MPNRTRSPAVLALIAIASIAAPALAAPTPVSLDVRLDNGSWVPLPADDMKSATADAALARISEGGWLRVLPETETRAEGTLIIDVSLVAKAQIAKAVLTLETQTEATYVATASISVRGLDAQGFHRAFEHVGRESAERLHSMLVARHGGPARVVGDADDAHWRQTYDTAQEKKHAGQYAESRALFEQVAAASGPGTGRLSRMASDELRFGLPVMEARQTLVGASTPGSPRGFMTSMTRAEGLYRQIQAENPTHVARIQEAQQALDQIAVMRSAYERAARTQVVMRLQEVRMMLTEVFHIEGGCPDTTTFERTLAHASFDLKPGQVVSAADGSATYTIIDAESGLGVPVTCDLRRGVEFDLNGVLSKPARVAR